MVQSKQHDDAVNRTDSEQDIRQSAIIILEF